PNVSKELERFIGPPTEGRRRSGSSDRHNISWQNVGSNTMRYFQFNSCNDCKKCHYFYGHCLLPACLNFYITRAEKVSVSGGLYYSITWQRERERERERWRYKSRSLTTLVHIQKKEPILLSIFLFPLLTSGEEIPITLVRVREHVSTLITNKFWCTGFIYSMVATLKVSGTILFCPGSSLSSFISVLRLTINSDTFYVKQSTFFIDFQ
ncbi:hypothetical protein L9F63_010107, partial [Diploptera punctata]